jgi:hypothetical protein
MLGNDNDKLMLQIRASRSQNFHTSLCDTETLMNNISDNLDANSAHSNVSSN